MINAEEIEQLAHEIKHCQDALLALGDENRQHLILEMMQIKDCHGVRVVDLARKSNLSRPAVSHHLQILKKAGIVSMRREGTKNYYYFNPGADAISKIIAALLHAKAIMESCDIEDIEKNSVRRQEND